MTAINKLSNAFIRTAKTGEHCDGAGLWFRKRTDGGGQWVLRYSYHGKRRIIGLGGYPSVTLKLAREKREKLKSLLRQGIDPKSLRKVEKSSPRYTLEIYVEKVYEETIKHELKNNGETGRWLSPLKTHVFPKIGAIDIESLTADDVVQCLKPIWHTKPDPAIKALGRISRTIDIAEADDLNVDLALIKKTKIRLGKQIQRKDKHLRSMNYRDVPRFYASLLDDPSQTKLALRLLILTAARVGPLRHLELKEISGKIWTIPKEKMKGREGQTQDFQIPLSEEALKVIEAAKPLSKNGFLFAGEKEGAVISDNTLGMHMRRANTKATAGGFRATIRTWLEEVMQARFELSEAVMAHKVGNRVTRAYIRTNLIEQRSELMDIWAKHVTSSQRYVSSNELDRNE